MVLNRKIMPDNGKDYHKNLQSTLVQPKLTLCHVATIIRTSIPNQSIPINEEDPTEKLFPINKSDPGWLLAFLLQIQHNSDQGNHKKQ